MRTLRSIAFVSIVAAGCAGGSGDESSFSAGLAQQPFYTFDTPATTPSYEGTVRSSRFNFNWDARLVFDGGTAPCSGDKDASCYVLRAFGVHPENVQVNDFTDLNGLDLGNLTGDASIATIEGAKVFSDPDGSVCGDENGTYVMGPGDAIGGIIIPATPDDFLPTPAPEYADGGGACGSDGTILFRYDFYAYYSLNYLPYTGDDKAKRCPTPTSGMARQQGFVIVKRNANGTVDPCESDLQKAPVAMDRLTSVDGKTFPQVDEQSTSADGRFIVINGGGANGLLYSFNATPKVSTSWSVPAPLSNVYRDLHAATVTVNGKKIPATDVVPLALEPLRKADGTAYAYGEYFAGAYPWMSADATEVFYEAVRISQKGGQYNGATRSGFSVIGRLTGNVERFVDGVMNPDRGNIDDGRTQERENMRSPGLVPGLWNNWRSPGFALPLMKRRLVYPMMATPIRAYDEVAFDSFAGGTDVLFLEMNELVVPDDSGVKKYDLGRTPDISGQVNTGVFAGGVEIPEYLECAARTSKEAQRDHGLKKPTCAKASPFFVYGKAARLPPAGKITVASNAILRDFGQGLSLGFFIRQDVGAVALAGTNVTVVRLPGAVRAIMKPSATGVTKLTFTLSCKTGDVALDVPVFASPSDFDWKHVAVTYDSVTTSTVTAYLDGLPVATTSCGNLADTAHSATDPLTIGPAISSNGGTDAVYWIDELRLSRVERSAMQIADDAMVQVNLSATLPAGLAASDLQLAPALSLDDPDQYASKVKLGQAIFVDKRFSIDGTVACLTCHDPRAAFADPRGASLGLDGKPLPRNAPSLYDRAFGNVEMWDGAHASLEAQATAPFLNPNEMGLTKDQLVGRARDNYKDSFVGIYGGTSQAAIADAVSHYTRSLLAGTAPIDAYLSGTKQALTVSQRKGYELFRGKARCIACHNGSNFSDEQFHRQGFALQQSPADAGLAGVACAPSDAACRAHFQGWFKTPSLRNVALTAPYFHNGAVKKLADVVAAYSNGSDDGSTNHDSVIRPLGLSAGEQAQLVDFLANALTGTVNGN